MSDMTDLERLDEAIRQWTAGRAMPIRDVEILTAAARAYRDLLANGERVEPDYEAAAKRLQQFDHPQKGWNETVESIKDWFRQAAHLTVDAAIGDRLLIDPPKEEAENE